MEVKITVPDSLKDIPLHKYQKFQKVLDVNKEASLNDLFIQEKILQIFCDLPLSDALKYRKSDIDKITEMVAKTLEQKPDLVQSFTIGETEFGFIPKLEDMTFGEYIDLDNSIGDIQNLHKAMAVLYRPVNFKLGNKYDIAPYEINEEIQEVMKEMPMNVVLSSMVFFSSLGTELLLAIPRYLEKNLTKENMQQLEQYLEKNGDGINQSMLSLKGMSRTLKRLQSYHYSNV